MSEHSVVDRSKLTYLSSLHQLLRFCWDGPLRTSTDGSECYAQSRDFIDEGLFDDLASAHTDKALKAAIKDACANVQKGKGPFKLASLTSEFLLFWTANRAGASGETGSARENTRKGGKSAVHWLYEKAGDRWLQHFQDRIDGPWTSGLVGLTKLEARSGGRQTHRHDKGKPPLSFGDYAAFAAYTIGRVTGPAGNATATKAAGNSVRMLFGHCVLLLQWSLMCRASNALLLNFSNLSWSDDALCV